MASSNSSTTKIEDQFETNGDTNTNTNTIIPKPSVETTQDDNCCITREGEVEGEGGGECLGPLSRLSEKAAQSADKVIDALPSSVRPVMERGREVVDKVGNSLPLPVSKGIQAVDETLQSAEAQRVAGSTIDLIHAVAAFTLMILTMTVTRLENVLHIDRHPPPTTCPRNENEEEKEKEKEKENEQNELEQHCSKMKELYGRYKLVVCTAWTKFQNSSCTSSSSSSSSSSIESSQDEQKKPYDPHSIDKVMKGKVKKSVEFISQVGAYSLSQASQFNGPGSSTIVQPTAQFIISKLPEDAKRVVSESRSPF